MRFRRTAWAALATGLLASLGSSGASAKLGAIPRAKPLAPLTLGFSGGADTVLAPGKATKQNLWIPRAEKEGTQIVRLSVFWSEVAPATPEANFVASNAADPEYDWAHVDAQVRELAAAHFKIMITVTDAPRWAEGPDMPKAAVAGTWRPNPTDLEAFATAIATRYDGSFADPLTAGSTLPRVHIWQAWDEPNLPDYLSPQWTRSSSGRPTSASPGLYRRMEKAFYSGVKRISASNYVVLAGLGPYGDSPSTSPTARMRPVMFERELLCVTPKLTRQARCNAKTMFDALDSHPYGIGGPNWHAYWADDVAIPDVHKLVTVLHAAEKLGTAQPRGPKGNWVTETSWDTKPPDPHGVPARTQGLWLEQALFNLWKQGVRTVLWWQIADAPPIPNYASSYQAGVYYLTGRAKPSASSFRFPFITWRTEPETVMIWARAPSAGVLFIQERSRGGWTTLARERVIAREVFEVPLRLTSKATLRAQIGADTSLPWPQSG